MKKQFAIMLALASAMAFSSCDDDDNKDQDNVVVKIEKTEFTGSSKISSSAIDTPFENDVVVVSPMADTDDELYQFYQLEFAAHTGGFTMPGGDGGIPMQFSVGAFTVDNLVATVTDQNNYSLKRAQEFAIPNVEVAFGSLASAPMTLTGTVSEVTVKDGVMTLLITDLKMGKMPMALTLSYVGKVAK